jgi:hypothetical protein
LIGKEEITQESLTYGVDGSRVATASIRQRELAPIHSLVQQRPGQALALLSHRRPVRLLVHPYTQLEEFRDPISAEHRRRDSGSAAAFDEVGWSHRDAARP